MAEELTYQQVMQMFAETDRRMREGHERLEKGLKELREGYERLQKNFDRSIEEEVAPEGLDYTGHSDSEMSPELSRLYDMFESPCSRLIDALAGGGELARLLKPRGIDINHTSINIQNHNRERPYNFDIFAGNRYELVVVDVCHAGMEVELVNSLIDKLEQFKSRIQFYRNTTVYGAVAYLHVDESAFSYAQNRGLFVIKAVGNETSLFNSSDFQPRIW